MNLHGLPSMLLEKKQIGDAPLLISAARIPVITGKARVLPEITQETLIEFHAPGARNQDEDGQIVAQDNPLLLAMMNGIAKSIDNFCASKQASQEKSVARSGLVDMNGRPVQTPAGPSGLSREESKQLAYDVILATYRLLHTQGVKDASLNK